LALVGLEAQPLELKEQLEGHQVSDHSVQQLAELVENQLLIQKIRRQMAALAGLAPVAMLM
tara:strand:- start:542 stop:724 length:183 start_codon:yes stop_codon:yes gene_type:complete